MGVCREGWWVLSSQIGQAEKRRQHEVKKWPEKKRNKNSKYLCFSHWMSQWVDNHKHYATVNAEKSLKKKKPKIFTLPLLGQWKKYLKTWCESASILTFSKREMPHWKWFPDHGKHLRGKRIVKCELRIQFVTYSRCRESFRSVSDMIIMVWYTVHLCSCDCSLCLHSLLSAVQFRLKANEMPFITRETVRTLMGDT